MAEKIENALVQLNGTKYAEGQIYQANPLIEACKEMDLLQGRLYYLSLMALTPQLTEEAKDTKKEFDKITFSTADIIKLFGGYGGYHKKLMDKTKRLRDRGITIITGTGEDGKPTFKQIGIFNTFEWNPKKGGLLVEFTKEIKPFVFDLAGGEYTKIAGRTMFALQSVYATRLIELLLQYQGFPEYKKTKVIKRNITVEKLRFYLDIPQDKYKRMGNFRKVVLDAPIEDINKHTAYKMSYNPVKRGQMIVSFDFTLDIRQGEEQPKSISEVVEIKKESKRAGIDPAATVDNLAANIIDVLQRYGVSQSGAKALAAEYTQEKIRANIIWSLEYKKHNKIRKTFAGLVRWALSENMAEREQLTLFNDAEATPKYTSAEREKIEREQRAADKIRAYENQFRSPEEQAPLVAQPRRETEQATDPAAKPSPAPEPVQTTPEDKDRLSVSIETIKMFVDGGKAEKVVKELAKLAKKGISIDDVRALNVEELEARYKAAGEAKKEPVQVLESIAEAGETPLENIQDQEPPASPEPNFYELEHKPEFDAQAEVDTQIYDNDYAKILAAIKSKVAQLNQKELRAIKDSVEKKQPAGMMLEMRLKQLDLNIYDAYQVIE